MSNPNETKTMRSLIEAANMITNPTTSLDEANQRLKKSKPYEELYYKWFAGVEVSVMDMGKIAKEIQSALDTKADLNKVMPELVKKYGKNSLTKPSGSPPSMR